MNFARSAFGLRSFLRRFVLLPLRFLQLLPDLAFFVANVAEVALKERQLRGLRVRVVEQSLIVLATPVRWARGLRLPNS